MARNVIDGRWNTINLSDLNDNFRQLFDKVEIRRDDLLDDMWEKTKETNVLKIGHPVSSRYMLPSYAEEKTFCVVEDENGAYIFTNGEWVKFMNFEMNPYVDAKNYLRDYADEKINDINGAVSGAHSSLDNVKENIGEFTESTKQEIYSTMGELTTAKNDAIEAIENKSEEITQLGDRKKSEISSVSSEIESAKEAAIQSVNDTRDSIVDVGEQKKRDIQAMMTTITNTKDNAIQAVENTRDSIEQLGNNKKQELLTITTPIEAARDKAVKDVAALNTADTSHWQKLNLTDENGNIKFISQVDITKAWRDSSPTGWYYGSDITHNITGVDRWGYVNLTVLTDDIRRMEYIPHNSNDRYACWKYENHWSDWEKVGGKYEERAKLIDNNGTVQHLSSIDTKSSWRDSVKTGFYYIENASNIPSYTLNKGFVKVFGSDDSTKRIEYTPNNSNNVFAMYKNSGEGWSDWKKIGGEYVEINPTDFGNATMKVLATGNLSYAGSSMTLVDSYSSFKQVEIHVKFDEDDVRVFTQAIQPYTSLGAVTLTDTSVAEFSKDLTARVLVVDFYGDEVTLSKKYKLTLSSGSSFKSNSNSAEDGVVVKVVGVKF